MNLQTASKKAHKNVCQESLQGVGVTQSRGFDRNSAISNSYQMEYTRDENHTRSFYIIRGMEPGLWKRRKEHRNKNRDHHALERGEPGNHVRSQEELGPVATTTGGWPGMFDRG